MAELTIKYEPHCPVCSGPIVSNLGTIEEASPAWINQENLKAAGLFTKDSVEIHESARYIETPVKYAMCNTCGWESEKTRVSA